MVLLLALLACAPSSTPGASAEGRLVAGSLAWVPPPAAGSSGALLSVDRQRALLAIEARADAVVAQHAAARAAAAATLYARLAAPPAPAIAAPGADPAASTVEAAATQAAAAQASDAVDSDIATAVDTLVAADRAVWLAAVDASLAALELTPAAELAGTPSPVPLGAVDRLVRDQTRLSIPPVEDLRSLDAAERDAVYAAERARTEALAAALPAWRDAVASWAPGSSTDPIRAAALPLSEAFAASARARPAVARRLLDALDPADRARAFVSPGLRAYVGASPVGEEWGFAFHRDGPTPPDHGPPAPGGPAPQPQDAPPPEVHPPQEFPAGTGDPGAFPIGTGSPDVLPQGEPAPDGAAPPPEVHQNGPPPPPPPPPGVDPPPGVAGPPKEGGFNGMRPQP